MEYGQFWRETADWPRDTATHVFLGRALHQFGKALYPHAWTGDEPIAAPVVPLPPWSQAKRRDRLEAHRLLAGDPMYEVKPDNEYFPGSLGSRAGSVTVVDYKFTDLEWTMAREIQQATVETRRPSWSRLISVQQAIVEHATFGRLRTDARKKGQFGYAAIAANAWSVFNIHAVFAYCTVPLREFAAPGTAPIYVLRADLDQLTTGAASDASPVQNQLLEVETPEVAAPELRTQRLAHPPNSVPIETLAAQASIELARAAADPIKWDSPPPLLEPPGFLSMQAAVKLFEHAGDGEEFISGCAPAEDRLRRSAASGRVSAVMQLWRDGSVTEFPAGEWLGPRAPMFFTDNGSVFTGTDWAFIRVHAGQAMEAAKSHESEGQTEKLPEQPNQTPKKKRGAPNLGSNDRPFTEMMRQLVENERYSPNKASAIIVAEHRDRISGTGNDESRARRLREGYKKDRRDRGLAEVGE